MGWEKYSAKKDANHNEIADVFRAAGYSVKDTHQIKGFVDFIAASKDNVYFIECKSKYGKLTPEEKAFGESWPYPVWVLRSTDEAITLITYGNIRNGIQ